MNENLTTKEKLLRKLRDYANTPDDDNIKYKNIIKNALLNCPELLYSLHDEELESELFDDNGNLYMDEETGKLLGEVDRYFGSDSLIRPFLFIPDTQTTVKCYICYQVEFNEMPRYNNIEKYTLIIFNIFVHGDDRVDKLTGIPRHDLIASIIREKFNWSSIFGMQAKLISSKESTTDNNYICRTLTFQVLDLNGIVNTPYGQETQIRNNEYWK